MIPGPMSVGVDLTHTLTSQHSDGLPAAIFGVTQPSLICEPSNFSTALLVFDESGITLFPKQPPSLAPPTLALVIKMRLTLVISTLFSNTSNFSGTFRPPLTLLTTVARPSNPTGLVTSSMFTGE